MGNNTKFRLMIMLSLLYVSVTLYQHKMKSSHRKTFNKLKQQNSLLRSTKDQVSSETYKIWLESKDRLSLNITLPNMSISEDGLINAKSVDQQYKTVDFYDVRTNKVYSPNIGLKSKTHKTNHRKQLESLFGTKDWKNCLELVVSDLPKSTIKKLSISRSWQNNANLTKKNF